MMFFLRNGHIAKLREYISMQDIKVHFIANPAVSDDLGALRSLAWEDGTIACTMHSWVWPVYCRMKMRGGNVSIGYALEADAVNFIHGQNARKLLSSNDFRKYYIIGVRADFRPFPYGKFEIVQNKHTAGRHRIYMPHLPQPGLVVRDADREVVNVCFSGRVQNSIDIGRLEGDLQKMGCQVVFKGVGKWHEMSDVDILLGIRSFSKDSHDTKPPTKLINAWLAGIPFIGGYDSAFDQVGTSGENYLRVSSFEELVDSIETLTTNESLYQQLVDKGKKAGEAYTVDKTSDLWVRFFEEQVTPSFELWRSGPSLGSSVKAMFLSLQFLFRERIISRVLLALKIRGK